LLDERLQQLWIHSVNAQDHDLLLRRRQSGTTKNPTTEQQHDENVALS
jgi:hypothetical protein